MPRKFVRATDPDTGAEVSVTEQRAKALGLQVHANKKATGLYGQPLPAKPRTDKAGKPVAPKSDSKEK